MSISDETLRLQAERMVTLSRFVDDSTRMLVRGWVRTWDMVAADLQDALELAAERIDTGQRLTWRQANDVDRLNAALQRAAAALDDLAATGRVSVTNAVGDAVSVAEQFDPQVIASQLPEGTRQAAAALISGRTTSEALDQIVARTQQRITALMSPLSSDAQAAMRRELIRGIAVGDNPRTAARRMLRRVESGFNGGLTRAVRIARTEMLDAYRTTNGHIASTSPEIVDGWTWVATLDARTCPACLAMHGRTFPTDQFGPEGHPQCRCDRVETVRPWRDLGFAAEQPPSLLPDARGWFDSQPPQVRRQIMGPSRLDALEQGAIGWDDIPRYRDNPDWRPAYDVAPLRDLGIDIETVAG